MALIVKRFIKSQRESSADPPKPKNCIKGWWKSVFGKFLYRGTRVVLSHQAIPITSWYSCLDSKWALESSADKESCVDNAAQESCVDICESSVDLDLPTKQTKEKSSTKKSCSIKAEKTASNEDKKEENESQHKADQGSGPSSGPSGPSKRKRKTKCKKVNKPICTVSIPKREVRDRKEIGSGHVFRKH